MKKNDYEIRVKFDGVPIMDTKVSTLLDLQREFKKIKHKMG